MPLPLPNLDDRSFEQLLEEARRQIARSSPDWTDLSPGDPGMVLLELFAYLTETMIYRLNRLPQKAYLAFLNLLGVDLYPPAAAAVMLRFSRARGSDNPIEIPRGTRVTVSRPASGGEPPVFTTARTVTLAAGDTEVDVLAYHCDLVEGELLGKGTGLPGLSVNVKRPPIVASTGDELDLLIGVAVEPAELDERAAAIQFEGQAYRIWREVENFSNLGDDRHVYVADRNSGKIAFAPAARLVGADGRLADTPQALAAVPPAGREVRAWYRRGGGPAGNVAANTLTTLKDPIPGLQVNNPSPATGGQAAESLDNALVRGPQELHSLQRAVTARDFEVVARDSSRAVVRARAFTRAALWRHATPGTVEVLLVPYLAEEERPDGRVTAAALREHETGVAHQQIQEVLNERRPLGTTCIVNWANYKTIQVKARIVVGREEDQSAVKQRVLERLHQTINPLPTRFNTTGWPFGQALRASDVYNIALAEPGVRWVDRVRLLVEEVPDKLVATVAADFFQEDTWFVGSESTLFRSLDAGTGWEPAAHFTDETITVVRPHPNVPGHVVVATQLPQSGNSRLYVSRDCGETWETVSQTAFKVVDLAWMLRGDVSILLLATDKGLYELPLRPGGSPVQLVVDPGDQNRGFYTVASATDARGGVSVAVASQHLGGVFLSSEGGRTETFRLIGLKNEDVRQLTVQYDGPRTFLWAGITATGGDDPGKGCFRWELRGAEDPAEGWRDFSKGWKGGSCLGVAFLGTMVMAASHRAGVLKLDPNRKATWEAPDVRCGLPLRDPGRFHPVITVAADPQARLVMAGGVEGIYRSQDEGVTYSNASSREFAEKVTLPETWLFVSGEHDITVVGEDEANRD
ncbi:MAG: putative baseplate assembly protein [Chloroflexi bacterium]|nr:putative baseplate assembly protein [Chloroflexota bacterium]MCI0580784.1 putative baseplate assembly protein [Chloroflexota bacterium]MCI0648693.1 putative baseplate assembly protein [Chloroflexota bacterium]MCI0731510.1 putative baseplate assembly protein [Chloroflexota bacterium]